MNVFVLNCGSSSIKFQLINTSNNDVLAKGLVEKIGEKKGIYTYKSERYTFSKDNLEIPDHPCGIKLILNDLLDKEHGAVSDISQIKGVGHRVAHGGEKFLDSTLVNEKILETMKDFAELAPLHVPANLKGIYAVKEIMSSIPQVAVFDTSFHQTMPSKAFLYAIPIKYYKELNIRRYGFHGPSHKFVAQKAAEYLNKSFDELKLITCHIGNGASITAIKNGKSIDTSMGFTPLEGLVMGTRCGDLDPALISYMVKKCNISLEEIDNILNKKSGILGLSEKFIDMRDIEDGLNKKDKVCITAWEVYTYRLKKYIGAYFAALNGADAIIFTGGVGENMYQLREESCSDMQNLGIEVNIEKNKERTGDILDFTGKNSKVKLLKIPTNEELMIALDTGKLLGK